MNQKDEKDAKTPTVKVKRYYAPVLKTGLYIPVKDDNGKPMVMKDAGGNKIMRNGQFVPQERMVEFTPVVTNPKLGTYCVLETSDPDVIEVADKAVADRSSPVVSEDQWKKSRNKEAYQIEKQLEGVKGERDALAKANSDQSAEIERLKAELAKAGKK